MTGYEAIPAPDGKVLAELQVLESQFQTAENEVLKRQAELYNPLYAKRRPLLQEIPGFWPIVIAETQDLQDLFNYDDMQLMDCLSDLDIARDPEAPRDFTITMTFDENEMLADDSLTLKKSFVCHEDKQGEYSSQPVSINWKKDISRVKKGERPSFFQFFQWTGQPGDVFEEGEEVAMILADEVYIDAMKVWASRQQFSSDDGSDTGSFDIQSDDDQENEDEDEQSDDEAPKSKKARLE